MQLHSDNLGNVIPANFINGSLIIDQPPQISGQPANAIVAAGQNAWFGVSANGTDLSWLWQLSTNGGISWNDLANDATYSGVNSPNLFITNALLSQNNFKYRCWITGTCLPPVYSNIAALTVTDPVYTSMINSTFCPGDIVVPVLVTNLNSAASFSLTFSYNISVLTYTGYQSLNNSLSGGTFMANAIGGKVYLTWYSTTAASIVNDTLIKILFTAVPGSTSLLGHSDARELPIYFP